MYVLRSTMFFMFCGRSLRDVLPLRKALQHLKRIRRVDSDNGGRSKRNITLSSSSHTNLYCCLSVCLSVCCTSAMFNFVFHAKHVEGQ